MLKKISTLIGSAGISQVISFIALPVISRLVQPEEFGYFYYYSSIAGIIGGISTFKMEQLFFSTNKNEAFYLRKKIIHVVLCVFLLSLLVVLGLRYFSIVNEPVWLIIPFGILSTSLIIPNYFYLLRIGDIQWLGYSRVLLAISQSGLQILACIINPSFYSLLFSFFLSQFINAFFLSIKCHPIKTNVITGREKESTKFGVLIYASISSIFQALNTSFLPSFFIYFNYIHIGGIVAVIHRMCMIPVNFLASNISHIVLAEFKSKQETIVNILLASLFILIFTDVILFLCFDEIGKLIIWFLGPEWTEVNDILCQGLSEWC